MRSIALALVLLVALPAAAQEPAPPMLPAHVSAQGTAEVHVAPDLAVVRLGVWNQAPDAKKAIGAVNQSMQRVIAAIRKQNVPENRIATERLDLQPVYDNEHPDKSGMPRMIGFRASNIVRIEIPIAANEGAKVGGVIDAALGAGANNIEGIEFQLENDAPHRIQALQAAADNGRKKAEAIAGALGAKIGPLLEASEAGTGVIGPPPMPYERVAMMKAGTSVQPGELTLQASVTVRYRIERR